MKNVEVRLYRYAACQRRITELETQVDEILAKRQARIDCLLSAPRLDQTRVMGGDAPDPVYKAVQKLVDVYGVALEGISAEIQQNMRDALEILGWVNNSLLNEREREYIRLRYFEERSAGQITGVMGYDEGYLRRIKASAIHKLI